MMTSEARNISKQIPNPSNTRDTDGASKTDDSTEVSPGNLITRQASQARKMEALGRFAGSMAHDFNNLLTAINGYSQLLVQVMPADSPHRHFVEEIQKAGLRGADMTAKLMQVSWRQPIQLKVVECHYFAGNLHHLVEPRIGEDILLETHIAKQLGHVEVDPGHIEQMVIHLVDNAARAMPEGGRLSIEMDTVEVGATEGEARGLEPGAYIHFVVRDTGVGIEQQRLEHIFEPLFKANSGQKSSGFGLAMVYSIVTRNRGHVQIDSRVGEGTTVQIFLPRVEDPAALERT